MIMTIMTSASSPLTPRRNTALFIALVAAVLFASSRPCGSASFAAFSPSRHAPRPPQGSSPSAFRHVHHSADVAEIDAGGGAGERSHPVTIRHQGHVSTISVREGEPILQALERQSMSASGASILAPKAASSLALSHIPHECRRGSCLTCSSRVVSAGDARDSILANVDNGLSPTVASALDESCYILTCCSYVTGSGVVLELDQNHDVWDLVYQRMVCDGDAKRSAMEARARLLRRASERNVVKWTRRLEASWEEGGDSFE